MGWHQDRLKAQRRGESPVGDQPSNVCAKCGASGSDPCLTPSGKVAKNTHAGRGE